MSGVESYKEGEINDVFPKGEKEELDRMQEELEVKLAISTWREEIPDEKYELISKTIEKGEELIGTEYNLGGTLGTGKYGGIDCSHFVSYSLGLPQWKKENTWSLYSKYKNNEVGISAVKPGDLVMWPRHYDSDVGRKIGHVELAIGKTVDGKIVTLGASGLSRKGNKYDSNGIKLPKHNCVGFSVREVESGMKFLRV